MYIIDTLKHNAFKEVDVPSPSELYKKLGFGRGSQKTSGEEFLDPSLSKIQQAQEVQREVDETSAQVAKQPEE